MIQIKKNARYIVMSHVGIDGSPRVFNLESHNYDDHTVLTGKELLQLVSEGGLSIDNDADDICEIVGRLSCDTKWTVTKVEFEN